MGTKPSNNFQSDRPESGGANRDDELQKSGLLEREKQAFAESEAEKGRDASATAQAQGKTGMQHGVETPQNTE